MKHLILALGNPGDSYTNTRHNAGWLAIDFAYPHLEWARDSYANAGVAADGDLLFAKPATFMNLSGETAAHFMSKKNIEPDQIIVVYDDIDLPLGTMKISYDRGSGGHNGIKSIESHVGGRNFIRIRIGISKMIDGSLVKPNVLGKFEEAELKTLKDFAPKVKKAIEKIVSEGKEAAMNEFNQ